MYDPSAKGSDAMIIGILSDTHGRADMARRAVEDSHREQSRISGALRAMWARAMCWTRWLGIRGCSSLAIMITNGNRWKNHARHIEGY